MEFRLLTKEEKETHHEAVFTLLSAADEDFVPPLSKRSVNPKTNRNTFSDVKCEENLRDYLAAMISEEVLAIFEGGKLSGFVSFAENLKNDVIDEETHPNIYIGTAVISEELRGRGTLSAAYNHLFNEIYPDRSIFTRTWSTNAAHIRVLGKFGFSEIKRIKNDRGDGIDTIYFAKKR